MRHASKKSLGKDYFTRLAEITSGVAGRPSTFLVAVLIVLVWGMTGPLFNYADTWQLIINTGTTIVTFLMVFLIQNTQNRDAKAVQIKLDEIIRALPGAHTVLLDLEKLTDSELQKIRKKYLCIAAEARERIRAGGEEIDIPDVILEDAQESGEKPLKKRSV